MSKRTERNGRERQWNEGGEMKRKRKQKKRREKKNKRSEDNQWKKRKKRTVWRERWRTISERRRWRLETKTKRWLKEKKECDGTENETGWCADKQETPSPPYQVQSNTLWLKWWRATMCPNGCDELVSYVERCVWVILFTSFVLIVSLLIKRDCGSKNKLWKGIGSHTLGLDS